MFRIVELWMKRRLNHTLWAFLTVGVIAIAGCASRQEGSRHVNASVRSSLVKDLRATGSIIASPNPIQNCGQSSVGVANPWWTSVGVANLSWTSKGATALEVHVGSPAGPLFSRSGATGSGTTGQWVTDGMVFYLQDTSNNQSPTPLTTLATVKVKSTNEGCPPPKDNAAAAPK